MSMVSIRICKVVSAANAAFDASVVHANKCHVGGENRGFFSAFVDHFDRVGGAGIAFSETVAGNFEDGALADAVVEFDGVHADGDELAVWVFEACGDP